MAISESSSKLPKDFISRFIVEYQPESLPKRSANPQGAFVRGRFYAKALSGTNGSLKKVCGSDCRETAQIAAKAHSDQLPIKNHAVGIRLLIQHRLPVERRFAMKNSKW
jgi:hypothetical protein